MNTATATYTIKADGADWVVVKTQGDNVEVMPRRFPWKHLGAARKYVKTLTA